MSSLGTASPPELQPITPETPKTWTVGTLRYDQKALFILFFWLMWNDFSIMLIERIASLNNVLMRDLGATLTQLALLATVGGIFTPWINPWVSTWSDRHRGMHGRRRPFLFAATPFFAFFLAITPYMPTLYHYLTRFAWMKALSPHLPLPGPIFFVGSCTIVASIFNAVVLAIFSYLYWDVVPDILQGRFQSLSKNVTMLAGLIWSFFIFGLADHHMKAVYVGTATFCLVVYLISVWQIKEGEYPPPDVHKKGSFIAPIRAYFVECFSQSYFLWIFAGSLFFQLGNKGNDYQFWYLKEDLHMNLAMIGWTQGWSQTFTTIFGVICGFYIGSLTDRLKPVRLMGPLFFLMALINLGSYFFIHDKWTCVYWACILSVAQFAYGTALGAFTVEVFPREKLGQFCSAQAVSYQFLLFPITPFIGMFFDHVKNNRLAYLWNTVFYTIAAFIYLKVYTNWKKKKGQIPVPHAG